MNSAFADAIGVLVMAYGGPDTLEDVEPYLMDVRGGRPTSPAIIAEVRERYKEIGGRSPILERTRAQASALQAALDIHGRQFQVYTAMRHWCPYIKDVLAEMAGTGIERAVGLVMAPHFSRLSVGAYYRKVDEARRAARVLLRPIEQWHLLPGYLDALAQHVRDALGRFPADERGAVPVVFTAHSLPERILTWDDPYRDQLLATVAELVKRLGPCQYKFAFQSAAMTPDPWLGPDVSKVVGELAAAGQRNVVVAPIGFVCEHVEILYDIDVALHRQARTLGIRLERIEMLNTAPKMIDGLAGLVRKEARQAGWL